MSITQGYCVILTAYVNRKNCVVVQSEVTLDDLFRE